MNWSLVKSHRRYLLMFNLICLVGAILILAISPADYFYVIAGYTNKNNALTWGGVVLIGYSVFGFYAVYLAGSNTTGGKGSWTWVLALYAVATVALFILFLWLSVNMASDVHTFSARDWADINATDPSQWVRLQDSFRCCGWDNVTIGGSSLATSPTTCSIEMPVPCKGIIDDLTQASIKLAVFVAMTALILASLGVSVYLSFLTTAADTWAGSLKPKHKAMPAYNDLMAPDPIHPGAGQPTYKQPFLVRASRLSDMEGVSTSQRRGESLLDQHSTADLLETNRYPAGHVV